MGNRYGSRYWNRVSFGINDLTKAENKLGKNNGSDLDKMQRTKIKDEFAISGEV